METPDKIYINGFSAFATEPVKDGEEYIRKDALLDWLQLERKKRKGLSLIYWGMRTAFGQVVNKIKSM